jgi:hypothetical protein
MSLPYPAGALEIVEGRMHGLRPEGPVIVVLHGSPSWDNALVWANPAFAYRWDWVRGLPNVVVVVGAETKFGSLLTDIESESPGQLDVIDIERELGWMVLFTKPRLRTVKWTKAAVQDWLGDQTWHKELNAIKAGFGMDVS